MRQISVCWAEGLPHHWDKLEKMLDLGKQWVSMNLSARLSPWSSGSQFPSSGQRAVSYGCFGKWCKLLRKWPRTFILVMAIREVETVWPWNREKSLDKRWSSQWALGKLFKDLILCLNAFFVVFSPVPVARVQVRQSSNSQLSGHSAHGSHACSSRRWFPGQESGTEGIFSSHIMWYVENGQKAVWRGPWTVWFIFLAVTLSWS